MNLDNIRLVQQGASEGNRTKFHAYVKDCRIGGITVIDDEYVDWYGITPLATEVLKAYCDRENAAVEAAEKEAKDEVDRLIKAHVMERLLL